MPEFQITNKFQDYFFNRKLDKNKRGVSRILRLMPFSEAQYIGLIVGSNLLTKDVSQLEEVLQLLNAHKKNYCVIALCGRKPLQESLQKIPNITIARKDITFGHAPSEKILQKLQTHHFDFLIDLNRNANKTAFFLEASTVATLRIGKAAPNREPFFDFLVEWKDSESPKQFVENIIAYLSMLTQGKKK